MSARVAYVPASLSAAHSASNPAGASSMPTSSGNAHAPSASHPAAPAHTHLTWAGEITSASAGAANAADGTLTPANCASAAAVGTLGAGAGCASRSSHHMLSDAT